MLNGVDDRPTYRPISFHRRITRLVPNKTPANLVVRGRTIAPATARPEVRRYARAFNQYVDLAELPDRAMRTLSQSCLDQE